MNISITIAFRFLIGTGMDLPVIEGKDPGPGRPRRIGEWDTIKNCAPCLAHWKISIKSVSCLWGERAASGSSKKYRPPGVRYFWATARKLSPWDFS